jgi:hypothetical protein
MATPLSESRFDHRVDPLSEGVDERGGVVSPRSR